MPIRFQCSKCKATLSISSRKAGTFIECPKCRDWVQTPPSETSLPANIISHESDPLAARRDLDSKPRSPRFVRSNRKRFFPLVAGVIAVVALMGGLLFFYHAIDRGKKAQIVNSNTEDGIPVIEKSGSNWPQDIPDRIAKKSPLPGKKDLTDNDKIDSATAAEVEILIAELKDIDDTVRVKAAKILGRLKEKAAAAIPALTEAINDPDEDVQAIARKSLAAIIEARVKKASPEIPKIDPKIVQLPPVVRTLCSTKWIHKNMYVYEFSPNGTYVLLGSKRHGTYELSKDSNKITLRWVDETWIDTITVSSSIDQWKMNDESFKPVSK